MLGFDVSFLRFLLILDGTDLLLILHEQALLLLVVGSLQILHTCSMLALQVMPQH